MNNIYAILITLALSMLSPVAYPASAEKVFEIASPSVVVVRIFDFKHSPIGLGSGVIVEKDKIITNCHVAEAKPDVQLQVEYQGATYSADLIGHLEDV